MLLNVNTFDEYFQKNAFVRSSLTPPLPLVYAMRTHRPRAPHPPPPSVRTYFMDDPYSVLK